MLEWLFGKKKEEPKKEEKKEKPKKSKQEQESEDNWMYQFLVQFLNSPLWRVSILDFVDQKCIVFDNQEENKFEYTIIHNEFKQLVGSLFDGMVNEVGLDDDKLVELLERGFQSKEKKLFNQLLLCDDFLKFKDLMLRRNKALENQAIKAMEGGTQLRRTSKLEKERDIVHQSLRSEEQRQKKLQEQEQQVLRKVLQMSKMEAEERAEIEKLTQKADNYEKTNEQKEKQEKKANIEEQEKKKRQQQQAAKERQQRQQQEKKRKVEQKKRQLKEKLAKKNANKLDPIATGGGAKLGDLPPLKNQVKKQVVPQKEEQEKGFDSPAKQKEPQNQVQQKQEQSPNQNTESLDDRKKRLMEQREKIRRKKQEERKKMLDEPQQQKVVQSIVLQDEGIHDSQYPAEKAQNQEKISKEQVQRRKQLMRKIKNRIVEDF